MSRSIVLLSLILASALAACGGDSNDTSSSTPASTPPSTAAAVTPTGRVITIDMFSDEKGNYYSPAKVEAHRGDVLRFVLKTGVHNVHFLPDSNPGKSGLPAASDLLQIPGQTWDFTVALPEGHYVFLCDPHAALGMIAKLEVEDERD
ncbi:MAG: plastocyanin/azurin family copper-binding protein [Gemmatimonadaceae bacterium]